MMDIKKEIELARESKKAIFLKNYVNPNINWDFMVEEINLDFSRKTVPDLGDTYVWKRENDIMMKDLFYIQLMSTFPTRNNILNELADKFANIFLNENSYQSPHVQFFINLVPKNSNIGDGPNSPSHSDNWDVVFVQLIGESTWNIYENQHDSNPIQSEIVTPGDTIIIPQGVYHEIYAHTPRAGISMGFQKNKNLI